MTFKADNKAVEVSAIATELEQGESGEGDAWGRSCGPLACSVSVRMVHGLELDGEGFELRRRGQARDHVLARDVPSIRYVLQTQSGEIVGRQKEPGQMRKRDAAQPERLETRAGPAQERLWEDRDGRRHGLVVRLVRPESDERHFRERLLHLRRHLLQERTHYAVEVEPPYAVAVLERGDDLAAVLEAERVVRRRAAGPVAYHDGHGGRQELQQFPHGRAGRAEELQVQTARRRKDETAPPPTNVRQGVPSPGIVLEIHPIEIEHVEEHVVGEHVECHTSCARNRQRNLRTPRGSRKIVLLPRLRRLNKPFQRRTKAPPVFELSGGIGPPIKVREDALGKRRPAILLISVEDTWRMGFRASLREVYQQEPIVVMWSESVDSLDVLFRSHRRESGIRSKEVEREGLRRERGRSLRNSWRILG